MLVALFGIGLLALGWRLRERNRTYALSVQGGGIAVLYLTIFASFSLYNLLPAAIAFPLLVVVTAAATALAVLQDAHALAVLGVVGGFLAPVLVSTGSNDHVALFGYYAVLDLAILGIAWFKAWRMLNVLGFLFTFGIGTLWGIDGYTPEKFATTEPFLVLFTAMYLVIPVLFATRVEPKLRGFVDGTLTFGTPIVAFTLQSQLVDTEYGLAISAVVLALYYVGIGTFLYRTQRESLRVLVEAQLALAVAFVTVAVPLALDARWTSAAWALQGAALVWLAYRQHRPLALLAGLALQALSGYQYVDQPSVAAEWPILNGYFLGALLLALAGFFSARLLDPDRERRVDDPPVHDGVAKPLSILLLLWAAAWWFFAGVTEIERSLFNNELAVLLGFASATTVLALLLAPRIEWPRLDWLGLTLWPVAALLAAVGVLEYAHPAAELGWLAWPVAIGSMLLVPARARGAVPAARRRAARDGVLVGRGSRRVGSPLARRARGRRRVARGRRAGVRRGAHDRDAAGEHGRRMAVRGARAQLRGRRLRCRARGADARDPRVECRVAGHGCAAAVRAAPESARARERARAVRAARLGRRRRPTQPQRRVRRAFGPLSPASPRGSSSR